MWSRWLFWGFLFWLAWRWGSPILARLRQDAAPGPTSPGAPPEAGNPGAKYTPAAPSSDNEAFQEMVRCARCGVYTLRSESCMQGQQFYCCDEHRRAGAR